MPSSRWNLVWAVPWLLVTWLLFEVCIFLPLLLLSFPTLALALCFAPTESVTGKMDSHLQITQFKNRFLDAWLGNYEDGICPPWWAERQVGKSIWWQRWTWFVRNPLCNLRYAPILGAPAVASRVRWVGMEEAVEGVPGYFVAWIGGHVGTICLTDHWKLWIGWKIKPEHRFGHFEYLSHGIGVTAQLRRFE